MERIINFPTRVQYTKEYLTKNQRVKQRQGIAQRLTRGHEGVVTIEWEGVKSIGHVHLDFLEEVLPATTISMDKNTQLPDEVVNEIHASADAYMRSSPDEGTEWGAYVNGATAYATKLHQVETFNGLLKTEISHLNTVIESLKAQPGPRWVKAHSGIPAGIYSMKLISRDNVEMRGTGLVNHGVIQLITFLNKSTMGIDDLPKDYEGVYYLDESPAAGNMPEPKWVKDALQWAKEAIDFTYDYVKVPDSLVETWGNMYMNTMHAIQEAQREIESPAAGREEDWIEFVEWVPTIAFFDDEYRLWELLREGEFINGQFRFTTKELYELFKQQKGK